MSAEDAKKLAEAKQARRTRMRMAQWYLESYVVSGKVHELEKAMTSLEAELKEGKRLK